MFLVRRAFKVKPGTARQAADIIAQMGKLYEEAGQRSPTRIYISGGHGAGAGGHGLHGLDRRCPALRVPRGQ